MPPPLGYGHACDPACSVTKVILLVVFFRTGSSKNLLSEFILFSSYHVSLLIFADKKKNKLGFSFMNLY